MKGTLRLTLVLMSGVILILGFVLAGKAYGQAGGAPGDRGQIEPGASHWRTWVIPSGGQMRLPKPPDRSAALKEIADLKDLASHRDSAALSRIAYWDAGSPSYRWIQIALAQFQRKPFTNPRIGRGMALMNVAIFDAIVAAWDTKYAYNRPRPSEFDPSLTTTIANPRSPSYPSEHAVAAGAAAAVLAYLYPDDAKLFNDQAEEAGRSRLLAGVQYASDVQAGLELGRVVAAKVIERAKTDGADAKWTGSVPTGPGMWNGTNPIEPLAGTWKTWVLAAGNQLRPPAPPAYDSAQKLADLAEIKSFPRTFTSNQKALYWQTLEGGLGGWYTIAGQSLFESHLDSNPPRAARAYAIMSTTHADAYIAGWDAKFTYWAIRPSQLDPTVVTLFPPPNHPTYPAAHGVVSGAISAAMEYLFPADADFIHGKADEAAWSRMWAGIHFRSDIETGLALGRSVARLAIERARMDGADDGAR